jgi:hypothetical protein
MVPFTPIIPASAAGIAVAKVQSFDPPGVTLANSQAFVNQILGAVGASPGDPWCASFLSWAFQQAANNGAAGTQFHYTAGTQDLLRWMNANCPAKVTANPQDVLGMTGAIFIATDIGDPDHGHTGFIINRLLDGDGSISAFITCEGNTTDPDGAGEDGAFIKLRHVANMGAVYGWSAVRYVNVEGFTGGQSW